MTVKAYFRAAVGDNQIIIVLFFNTIASNVVTSTIRFRKNRERRE